MKKIIIIVVALSFVPAVSLAGRVRGYYRKNGTYVKPHYRTNPNSTRRDNYSYPGNYNPNTHQFTPYPETLNPSADPWCDPSNPRRRNLYR